MVKEWLQWVAAGGRRRRSPARNKGGSADSSSGGAGCMCAVFQLFDLQHHPLSYQPDNFVQEQQHTTTTTTTTSNKGVEAPRNSLELVGPPPSIKVAVIKDDDDDEDVEDNSNFPVGIYNQIKTRASPRSRTDNIDHGFSSDCSPSTTKTPSLVARLMGLDLLPEPLNSPSLSGPSPSPKPKPSKKNRFSDDDIAVGARSSSAARRSDFEYHRLSLQINKENNANNENRPKSRGKSAKFKRDESTSPARHFAKQLVSQVKERVMSRRVGLADITNTDNCRGQSEIIRRDQNLVLLQPTRKNNNNNTPKKRTTGEPRKVGGENGNISSKKLQLGPQGWDYSIRDLKLLPRDESKMTDKKTKRGNKVISSETASLSGPTALPVRKDPSPPATKLPQKQSQVSDALSSKRSAQLSRNPSRSYLQSDQISTVLPDSDNGSATAAAYGDYVRKILKRAGINDKLTPLALGKWRTPSHPLDPSIFYYLELFAGGAAAAGKFMSRRCNRKLIFQLVDELLAEILKPCLDFNFRPRVDFIVSGIDNFDLGEELCRRIGNFPAAHCRVLEDIDFLIDGDFRKVKTNGGFEEEGERLVKEIEGEIMEWLLGETVAVVGGGGSPEEEEEEKRKTESRRVSRAGEGYHVTRCY